MRNSMLLATLILTCYATSSPAQAPQPPVVGVWSLKSATIGGKAAKDLSGMLDKLGGLEIGMEWKFRRLDDGRDTGFCNLNDAEAGFEFMPNTKELVLERETTEFEVRQVFGVKITGKTMKLKYREKGKVVELTFAKEE